MCRCAGVRVNAVRPTVVRTELALKAHGEEGFKKLANSIPIGRVSCLCAAEYDSSCCLRAAYCDRSCCLCAAYRDRSCCLCAP